MEADADLAWGERGAWKRRNNICNKNVLSPSGLTTKTNQGEASAAACQRFSPETWDGEFPKPLLRPVGAAPRSGRELAGNGDQVLITLLGLQRQFYCCGNSTSTRCGPYLQPSPCPAGTQPFSLTILCQKKPLIDLTTF